MSNETSMYRSITVIGFILLLFSISFIPVRIERLAEKRIDVMFEKETEEAIEHFQAEEHRLLKEQMSGLSEVVTKTNTQIVDLQ